MCSHFGHRFKCEHSLVCIVIDCRNVNKTLTMRRKCEHRAHNAVEILACEHHAHNAVRMWCSHLGKFNCYGKNNLQSNDIR